jgi:hypothetical protein
MGVKLGHWLLVFENGVLKRMFGPDGDEVTRDWIKQRNIELHDLYCAPSIIRIITSRRTRCGRACSTNEDEEFI